MRTVLFGIGGAPESPWPPADSIAIIQTMTGYAIYEEGDEVPEELTPVYVGGQIKGYVLAEGE